MSPLLRENGRTPAAYVSGASFLSWSFIGSPRIRSPVPHPKLQTCLNTKQDKHTAKTGGVFRVNAVCVYMAVLRDTVQFNSLTQSCPTLWDPVNHSTPGLPVHHQLPEFTQTHVRWVGDAIKTSHPVSSPSPPALNLTQHQGLCKWVSSSNQVAKVLEFQLQRQSYQQTPRTDLL